MSCDAFSSTTPFVELFSYAICKPLSAKELNIPPVGGYSGVGAICDGHIRLVMNQQTDQDIEINWD
jgi:hypothetical protein